MHTGEETNTQLIKAYTWTHYTMQETLAVTHSTTTITLTPTCGRLPDRNTAYHTVVYADNKSLWYTRDTTYANVLCAQPQSCVQ